MRTLFLTLLFFGCLNASAAANDKTIDSLYRQLDEAIAHSADYTAQRESRIAHLKELYAQAKTAEAAYPYALDLFNEYRAYQNDSAIHYISLCQELAQKMNDTDRLSQAISLLAFQYSTAGMYIEALDQLNRINSDELNGEAKIQYYLSANHVYGELGYYTALPQRKAFYGERQAELSKTLYSLLPASDDRAMQCREMDYIRAHNWQEALAINNRRMQNVDPNSHQAAILSFYRSLAFLQQGNDQKREEWLTRSAIGDVRNAVMDQGSLWELAQVQSNKGDVSRAHRYIRFAWDCANRFGSHVRSSQISPVLSVIDGQYQDQISRNNRQLRIMLGIIGLLSGLLLFSLYRVNHQRKHLAAMQKKLEESNTQLSTLNAQLSSSLRRLADSTRVKEEYIGRFLRLCSQYIDRMDKYRKHVNKKIKAHEYEDLYKETRSQEAKEKDVDELYEYFDSAFLHLFPNFVEEFNQLLKPEERIYPPQSDELTTEIRIFALIRLGISDSSKIAEFLRYSVNTIYNYRARIKNGAIGDREQFEHKVKSISLPE